MPRSRRRHHSRSRSKSRSRSRSRSHSHDRDREPKRRKIENVDSPIHKRSVSSDTKMDEEKIDCQPLQDMEKCEVALNEEEDKQEPEKAVKKIEEKLNITPKKSLSPKQVQKKLESEKKRQLKEKEREEREKKKQQEKEEREKMRKEKEEKKRKEREEKELKRKEKEEEKEAKRKEKEKELEAKRKEKEEREKEKEQERLRKQQELEEKNREKMKIEEQKQKAAQVFANFFVPKKTESAKCEERKMFMPFEVKSDMRLAPLQRARLSEAQKKKLEEHLESPKEEVLWLEEIKVKKTGKSGKTWAFEDDVILVEEDFGDSIIEEEKGKSRKMRAKFLKFCENRRPAYYGTWRKKSRSINGRKPFGQDKVFDYEVDSDEDWEEEEQGESLNGSDDEDKENEEEDYEVDNEFFVPHGHLSDDEIDEEASSKLSPESHKEKLKLLKDEFELDMQAKINRMKPRSIGCVFYKKEKNVDDAIDRYLKPLAMITNGQIILKKRKLFMGATPSKMKHKELSDDLMVPFLKLVEGNINNKISVVEEFIAFLRNNGTNVEFSKAFLVRCVKKFARWKKCTSDGPMLNKFCWCVDEDVKKKYNVE